MKKIFFLLIWTFLAASPLSANLLLDISPRMGNAGDGGNLSGGELALGYGLSQNILFNLASGFSYRHDNVNQPDEIFLATVGLHGGIEYLYPLGDFPLNWTLCAALGGLYYFNVRGDTTGPFSDPSKNEYVHDLGPSLTLSTGMLYYMNQRIGLFFKTGYSYSLFFGDFHDSSIRGFHFLFGVRFSLTGSNHPLL